LSEPQIALAAIIGAHGITGEVRLKLFAESLDSLTHHPIVRVGERVLTLQSVKPGKNAIARFAEINDRSEAEQLRGALLTVPRSALPPLDEGEYYHADLVGLPCEDAQGGPLGTVVTVANFGAGDILEIERLDGKTSMVPFREGIADFANGKIIVDPLFLA
jgi:16S rRNA processing protein RimM